MNIEFEHFFDIFLLGILLSLLVEVNEGLEDFFFLKVKLVKKKDIEHRLFALFRGKTQVIYGWQKAKNF